MATIASSLLAYGPTGHEIVGGIADKIVANTAAGEKIYALTDGITLEKAAIMADEIKSNILARFVNDLVAAHADNLLSVTAYGSTAHDR